MHPKHLPHQHQVHDSHPPAHRHGDDHQWSEETFVADWLQRQEAQVGAVRSPFAKVRALIPKGPTESFR